MNVKELREYISDLDDDTKIELWWVDPTVTTHTRNVTLEHGESAIGTKILSITGVEGYV